MPAHTGVVAPRERAHRHSARRVLLVGGIVALGPLLWWNAGSADIPSEGPWGISVAYPVGDSVHCFDDTVDVAFYTADYPGSVLSVTFVDEATRDDVERVFSCVEDSLTSGEIEVVQLTPDGLH